MGSSCPKDLMFHPLYKPDKFSNVNSISSDFHSVTMAEVPWVCQDFKKVGEAQSPNTKRFKDKVFWSSTGKSHTHRWEVKKQELLVEQHSQRGCLGLLKGNAPQRKERWIKTQRELLKPQARVKPLRQGCLTGSASPWMARAVTARLKALTGSFCFDVKWGFHRTLALQVASLEGHKSNTTFSPSS